MYNLIGRQLVLADKGGVPNQRIALISNPLDPAIWSDALADEMNIDFAWLDSPDYSDNFVRVNERLNAAMRHHIETERPREFNRIADEVFAKYGIVDLDEPISDGELLKKSLGILRSPARIQLCPGAANSHFPATHATSFRAGLTMRGFFLVA
jgi:hypothetical protein